MYICICVCAHLPDECEAAALACETITGDVDVTDFAASFEDATQVLRCRAIRQIVHLNGEG